jgi:hypothetical protein
MLLLYSDIKSSRLEYIADVIFSQLLGINVSITDNQAEYLQFEGPSINYSKNRMSTDLFFLQSQKLNRCSRLHKILPSKRRGLCLN